MTLKEKKKKLIMLKDANGYYYLSYILSRILAIFAVDSLLFVWR